MQRRDKIIRIKELEACENYSLRVVFDDGRSVMYDMTEDINTLPGYDLLKTMEGLFRQVQLDPSRTCVYWNEDIALPSDVLYEYGVEV